MCNVKGEVTNVEILSQEELVAVGCILLRRWYRRG